MSSKEMQTNKIILEAILRLYGKVDILTERDREIMKSLKEIINKGEEGEHKAD